VPVGVVVGADQLLGLLHKLPLLAALLTPQWTARLLGLSLGLSVGIVVNMALWTAFAAWQTDLLWRAMRGESPLNLSPWPSLQRYFLRAFLALAVGMGVLLLGLIPILAIGAVLFVVAIPAMGVFGVVWNLATAALLPVTLFSSRPLGASLAGGLRVSWDMKGRWWRGLLAQLLLLGLIIVLRVHFTRSAAELQGMGRGQMGMHTQTSVKWHVNAFWVGGFEHSCRWYTKYAEALETSPVPLVGEGLGLVFLVLAVAMKLTVLGELSGAADAVFGEKPLTAVPPPLPVVPPW